MCHHELLIILMDTRNIQTCSIDALLIKITVDFVGGIAQVSLVPAILGYVGNVVVIPAGLEGQGLKVAVQGRVGRHLVEDLGARIEGLALDGTGEVLILSRCVKEPCLFDTSVEQVVASLRICKA